MNKTLILSAMFLVLTFLPAAAQAGGGTAGTGKTTWQDLFSDVLGHYPLKSQDDIVDTGSNHRLSQPKNWVFDFGLQRFLVSHTSYEIGNSNEPFQRPLSRLEFPMNTWWLDFRLRRTCPRWSLGGRAGLSVARNTDGRMKDSDWEYDGNTDMLTTYSESACRAEQNYHFRTDVDVNISDWLGLPSSFEIRPLFAFQFQRLKFMAHDGVQWTNGIYNDPDAMDIDGNINSLELAGDSIHFRQDYYMYQIGMRGSYELKLSKYLTIKTSGEADWGPVLGYNEDRHLLRRGTMICTMNTYGNSLYFTAGIDMIIAKTITAGISMDYMRIRTSGGTRHTNIPRGQDESWSNGVKAWSDQTSLIGHIAYAF
ncbi:MAG: omptin family outer membrane protease [Candidatus Omnitrophota bacterium]